MSYPQLAIDIELYDKVTVARAVSDKKILVVIGEVKSAIDVISTPIVIEFFPMLTDSLSEPLEYSLRRVILNYVKSADVSKVFNRIDENSIENTKRLLNELKLNIWKKKNLVNDRISPFFNAYRII